MFYCYHRNLGRVTRQEIEAILNEIKASEVSSSNANLLSSQERFVYCYQNCVSIIKEQITLFYVLKRDNYCYIKIFRRTFITFSWQTE
jgi:hypothetical protein